MATTQIASRSHFTGLPPRFVSLLRCPDDNSELQVGASDRPASEPIYSGSLICKKCGESYPIENGILRLLNAAKLEEEAQFEINFRDQQAEVTEEQNRYFENKLASKLEIPQHVGALKLDSASDLLELACGRGRYTLKFHEICRSILAVDFSLSSLEFLARRLGPGAEVCLVQADITRLRLQPKSFNRAFSTTPLDSREERLKMHQNVSEALDDRGIFVFSTEHYDWRNRLLGNPRLMRYPGHGSVFERMRPKVIVREAAPYFMNVSARPIQIFVPFMTSPVFHRFVQRGSLYKNLGELLVLLISSIELVPWLRNFGNLLLINATDPIRPPVFNEGTRGSKIFRYVYDKLKLPHTTP
jgi:uncharacterized protein YbaR (Trm112 family)